jgi:hypothetical protein
MSKPKLTALPATLFLVGLGLSLHYGHAWWRLPVYTEQELENSVELNLALDLQREHRDQPASDSELAKRREQLRAEVLALVYAEKKEKQSGLTAGLLMLTLSLSYFVWLTRARPR